MTAQDPFAPPPEGAQPTYGAPPPAYGAPQLGPVFAYASPWRRLGAALLNGVLFVVTLGIGYLVWAMVLWKEGTNPAKKMLGMEIVNAETGVRLDWNQMLIRNFVFGSVVLGVLQLVTFGIATLVDLLMIFGARKQRLIDRMAKTVVVLT